MKIGFIGLGIMGRPMAKNLLKAGYSLTVYDYNLDAVNDLVEAGANRADSSAELAAKADLVMTMLPNSPHVKAAVLNAGGVKDAARPGTIFVDMSSINPIASREIAQALAEKGIEMLDAPVSGGEPKAVDGTLSFMVGGKREIFDKVRPILEKMGASVVLCGSIGAGNVTKLCNQIVVAANIAGLAEALMLGQKAGVDPQVIFQAIRGGLAGSTVMEAKAAMMIQRNFKPGFRIDLHIKDLNNVMDASQAVDSPTPLTAQLLEMMKNLHCFGEGGLDHSGLARYYERLANTEFGS